MATFLIIMPMMLLSGFMFPVESMPKAFQWITLVNPVRHYLEISRGVFLKGTGFRIHWPQLVALLLLGTALLGFAATRFRKVTA
jgi:ABC-2 type transport system permease protein